MATFMLHLYTENDAFTDDPCPEIARILRDLADELEGPETRDGGMLRDINGNDAGSWTLI